MSERYIARALPVATVKYRDSKIVKYINHFGAEVIITVKDFDSLFEPLLESTEKTTQLQ